MWLYVTAVFWVAGFATSAWLAIRASRATCDCHPVVMDDQGRMSHGIPRLSTRDMVFSVAALIFTWPWFLLPLGWSWFRDKNRS